MDLGLRGKSVAVMAGSAGLGLACAEAFVREGARVAICGRDKDRLEKARAHLASLAPGAEVAAIVADLSIAADVERFVNAAAADLMGLDVLVVNAGGPPASKFEETSDAQWQAAFELTFMSAARAIRFALPHFRAKGGGAVVSIGSTSVKQPIPTLPLSNGIRPGLVGLMKTLAAQYGPEHIRFNTVLPGSIHTARLAEAYGGDESKLHERVREVPLGKLGEPRDVGELVAFLASDRAKYITGTVLAADGGLIRGPL
ncbi:MAG: SDR family oxidoreductase [Thermoplasmatota archaeon]